MKRAIFPGSFDPITKGHESIIRRGLEIFDEIIVAVGYNSNKKSFFSLEQRIEMISDVFEGEAAIKIMDYSGLTVDFAKKIGAGFILRGLRTSADFEFERAIAQVNRKMSGIESVFILTTAELTPVNSTFVRDILLHDGDVSMFIPDKLDIKKFIK